MKAAPKLGPFRLQRPLAKGGMARIFRAIHEQHSQPVAIKIMIGEQARKPRFVESFHAEVRAVARMNHPNIIRVYDYGAISDEVASSSEHWLSPGCPYMVMELANSTLGRLDHSQLDWSHVHTILVYILDALAHSHARGLIHRDLKPDNILFLSDERGSRLKLSDFGIAYGMDGKRGLLAEDEIITGTPRYMAPEQILGHIRDQGPWTDLYALGCLAYWLVGTGPPFSADSIDEILRAHLTAPRPPLRPRIAVPRGFDEWTARLLARKPEQRFQRAADAAAALTEIAGQSPLEDMTLLTNSGDADSSEMTFFDDPGTTCLIPRVITDESVPERAPDNGTRAAVDIPKSWRHTIYTDDLPKMIGVGQSLFELRELPLLGRHQLRDILWDQLLDACYVRRPHLVLLDGPVGVGKTRLATWLGQHAHEVGAADVLHAWHNPVDSLSDGLPRMFADYLRCTGLEREKILERVRAFYDTGDGLDADDLHQCLAATELITPGANPDYDERAQTIRFSSPEQRWVIYRRLLMRIAANRPLVLIFDDVHWANDSLQFIDYLLQQSARTELPLLLVLTARTDLLDDNRRAGELLTKVLDRPFSLTHDVEPLPEHTHRELVESLLCLAPRVAEQVARRTRGNPLFAIQLVGDWIQRGLLEVGDDGFELASDETPPLPDDIRALLIQRLENITGQPLGKAPGPALLSLEFAALLGGDVDHREWRTLCDRAGVQPPSGLLESLAHQSLIIRSARGWSFLHGALREVLLEVADRNDRLPDHHRLCAETLRRLYDTSLPSLAPRLADHLLGAHAWGEALKPLCRAMQFCEHSGDYETGLEFFERHEKARRRLGLSDGDPRTLRAWLGAAELHLSMGDATEAMGKLDHCHSRARSGNHGDILGQTFVLQSRAAFLQGRYDDAISLGEQALDSPYVRNDADRTVRALQSMGWAYFRQSKSKQALRVVQRADELLDEMDNRLDAARALNLLGAIENSLGNFERTRDYFLRARHELQQMGNLNAVATVTNNLGDMCRTLGESERAARYYRESSDLYRRAGTDKQFIAESNLGLLRLEQGSIEEAAPHFRAALDALEHTENASFAISCHIGLAACHAHRGDFDAHDHHLARTRAHLDEVAYYNNEVGFVAQLTGEILEQKGEARRAIKAYSLALEQWRELGEAEGVQEIEARLDALSGSGNSEADT